MKYTIKTKIFEGPFDLLYHLIEENKIDIYDIPINEIIKQYMYYIYQMESLNLEIASEFLLMAATLIEIKSKLLLPSTIVKDSSMEMDEIDPRDELVKKLLEYKKYKIIAAEFKDKEKYYNKLYFKQKEELTFSLEEGEVEFQGVSPQDLMNIFKRILLNKPQDTQIIYSNNKHEISKESITIEEKTNMIINILHSQKKVNFNEIFIELDNKLDIVVSFLAILELVKIKKIRVFQDEYFDNIIIELLD